MQLDAPHNELTSSRKNEAILGTFQHDFWVGSEVELIAGKWWRLGNIAVRRRSDSPLQGRRSQLWHPDHPWHEDEWSPDLRELMSLPNPEEMLLHAARQSSGSIHGEHRKDLRDAVIGAPKGSAGLSVNVNGPSGDAAGGAKSPTPKGLGR